MIAWTRVHAITIKARAQKSHLSNTLDARHVAKRGGTDRHRTANAFRDRRHYAIIRSSSDSRDHSQPSRRAWSLLVRLIYIERAGSSSRSDLHRTAETTRGRTPRSRSDRTAIAVQSSRDRSSCRAESTPRPSIDNSDAFGTRSTADRAKIVADRAKIVAEFLAPFEEKFKPTRPEFEASTLLKWNRSLDAANPRSRPAPSPTISGLILSLKTHVLLLCSSTFDRLVKKLSEFRGRSLVHRVPPAFRLDCEAIGAGLITNFSLISSNFPLEFRTSTRKNPSKFASIHENWSPSLAPIGLVVRFDRLSGGNLSF